MFDWKTNEHAHVVRAKARLVARGFKQREGIDYFETFAPTPAASCIRLLGAIACELDLDLCHFDAEQAFVQSTLEEDVFMRLPQGCGEMSGKVVRLNRSLYGLKQASRSWHNHLLSHMKSLGFEQSPADACVMRLIESGTVSIVTVVHVDDIFAVGRKARCDQFCEDLNRLVPINNLGELRWYAGCRFSRDLGAGTLTISQQAFAENTAEKFGVRSGRRNPLAKGLKLDEFDKTEPEGDWPFRELVGCLMWLANQTRPDIANAVRAVARYAHSPRGVHWRTAIGILEYVFSTSGFGITFQRGSGLELVAYADADYASKATDRRSVSGGVVMCAGACVCWFSRTQKCVTLSTTEAEYVALADTIKEAIFLRYVWSFILPGSDARCITVFEDNEGARHLAQNPVSTPNSKHIDVRHHFLRELVLRGDFSIVHVESEKQHADFLTKALTNEAFRFHRDVLMNL